MTVLDYKLNYLNCRVMYNHVVFMITNTMIVNTMARIIQAPHASGMRPTTSREAPTRYTLRHR